MCSIIGELPCCQVQPLNDDLIVLPEVGVVAILA